MQKNAHDKKPELNILEESRREVISMIDEWLLKYFRQTTDS